MSSNDWARYKLEDIAVFHDSLRMPLNSREREKRKGKYPYYGASGIVDYIDNYIFDGEYVLISEDGENLRSRQTPIAFKADGKFWVNNHAHVVKGKETFLNDWIIYFFQNLDINPYITGAVQPKLNKENLQLIEIPLPHFDKAKKIVSILSALDEKIELNRQTNATLEAIAQSIFREWFVEFNFPGATGEMIESGLGMIPKGWQITSLGEIADLSWGDTNTTKRSYVDEGFPAYSASGQDGYLPYFDFDRTGIVVSAIGAYAGRTWLALGKWSCIKNTIRFWSTDENISNEFLYLYTRAENFWTLRGSAQPFISQTDSRNTKIIHPNNGLARRFGEIVRPLFERIEHNNNENNCLSQIRDGILPKLLNGEIDV